MHAVFGLRGNKKDQDEVIDYLKTRTMMLPVKDPKTGTSMLYPISAIVQPIQLISYVFPENEKDAVLTSIKFDEENIKRWQSEFKTKLGVEALRIMMGLDKIPEFKKDKMMFMPIDAMKNVSIIPIGVKYDDLNYVDPLNGTIHEAI